MKTQSDYMRAKKVEKAAQAQRQVLELWKKVRDLVVNGREFRGLILNRKPIEWRIQMEPVMEDIYSSLDIAEATRIPRERLRTWIHDGFIEPSLPATGRGTIAIFTRMDAYMIALFDRLVRSGFGRESSKKWIGSIWTPKYVSAQNFVMWTESVNGALKPWVVGAAKEFVLGMDNTFRFGDGPVTGDWDNLHFINLVSLRRSVDAALGAL